MGRRRGKWGEVHGGDWNPAVRLGAGAENIKKSGRPAAARFKKEGQRNRQLQVRLRISSRRKRRDKENI